VPPVVACHSRRCRPELHHNKLLQRQVFTLLETAELTTCHSVISDSSPTKPLSEPLSNQRLSANHSGQIRFAIQPRHRLRLRLRLSERNATPSLFSFRFMQSAFRVGTTNSRTHSQTHTQTKSRILFFFASYSFQRLVSLCLSGRIWTGPGCRCRGIAT
jgi:hypothetical protein